MTWTKEEVRTLRLRLGWSQCELARRLRTESSNVGHWEEGYCEPELAFQEELEILSRQAEACCEEVLAQPAAEIACASSSLDQIEFSCVGEDLQ